MKEELISFPVAKLAKEKGFKEIICRCGGFPTCICYNLAPTQSLLQRWLREKYNIHIEIHVFKTNIGFSIKDIKTQYYLLERAEYKTYEEALEEGLLEALKFI